MIGYSYRKKQQYKTALKVDLKRCTSQRKSSLHDNHPRNLNLNLFYLYFSRFLGITLLRRGGLKVDTVYAFYSADINLSNINGGSEDTHQEYIETYARKLGAKHKCISKMYRQ